MQIKYSKSAPAQKIQLSRGYSAAVKVNIGFSNPRLIRNTGGGSSQDLITWYEVSTGLIYENKPIPEGEMII